MIRIRSHVDGFRRAGKAHPAEWKEYPDDAWTEEQIGQLKAEPMLQVEFTGGTVKGAAPILGADGGEAVLPKYADITVEQIKARLDELKVDHSAATKKAEFYGLLELAVKKAEG